MGRLKQALLHQSEKAKTLLHLAELRKKDFKVDCACMYCGHRKIYHSRSLIRFFQADLSVFEIGPKLRCKRCDTKNIATAPKILLDKIVLLSKSFSFFSNMNFIHTSTKGSTICDSVSDKSYTCLNPLKTIRPPFQISTKKPKKTANLVF